MGHEPILAEAGFKKLYIAEMVQFAIAHVPSVDRQTLERFLALVNTDGTFGSITAGQLALRMRQLQKYVPQTCAHSLLVLADLLDLRNAAPPKPSLATQVRRGKPVGVNQPAETGQPAPAGRSEGKNGDLSERMKRHQAMPLGSWPS